jgi:hypothetical protein
MQAHILFTLFLMTAQITLPLQGWRPVREGVTIEQTDQVRASYTIVSNQPAGAALPIAPGTLEGIQAIKLRLGANRNAPLVVSLLDRNGIAYAFPAISARAGVRNYELSVDDLAFLPQQSRGDDPGSFKVEDAVLITILDISGYMSAETPDVEWTLESIEGVR